MKDFGTKSWILPQPVLIIGTYNNDGTPNAMNAAWGGQWDAKEIIISMGAHATTENLNRCGEFTVAILMNLARDLSDYFQFFGRKLHIVIFLALSKAFSARLSGLPLRSISWLIRHRSGIGVLLFIGSVPSYDREHTRNNFSPYDVQDAHRVFPLGLPTLIVIPVFSG